MYVCACMYARIYVCVQSIHALSKILLVNYLKLQKICKLAQLLPLLLSVLGTGKIKMLL